MNTKILIAAHKPYWMPEDSMYLPLQVGSFGKTSIDFYRDDEGENISDKNFSFCELTGLYWVWKHIDADVYGLCHYRRYFARTFFGNKKNRLISRKDVEQLMVKTDLILPRKRHYYIETNYSQYIHAHHEFDLTTTQAILQENFPEYLPAWKASMQKRSGHRFNMFLMRQPMFDAYCTWLFDILFELEAQLDISTYSQKDQRVFGYVAERLMDVWVGTNHIAYKELPVVNLEKQYWGRKIYTFLRRKQASYPTRK